MDSDFPPSEINTLPSSSSPAADCIQKPKKKRTKLVKVDGAPKPKYSRKPDPGAPKITRPCTECGKKFWSWKALFGHMRCHPERQWRGINPPPNHHRPNSSPVLQIEEEDGGEAVMTEEDHEIADCLLMLANAGDHQQSDCGISSQHVGVQEIWNLEGNSGSRFECSSCKKVFGSHQALGGHRASHKNVKGCFAINKSDGGEFDLDQNLNADENYAAIKDNVEESNKMLMALGHKCSICFRVFPTGQALGGHKRCHWEKADETPPRFALDLNLPAPVEDHTAPSYPSTLPLDLRLGL